ncbi:HlyD family secretion protein [Pontixanthobacter gangjinensis]|uniref:Biotin/lipoyl-binding protein n=1 Tax=Christiangramia aestuarii TaxID=1028746 RepID=A0A7M3SY09_9FLAO|nr:biotin/lipoyl-binding protein [Christiangramia aestuarii]MUP41490.1 biotin/lipoyl-binding protein [Christiangramia aestuarii]
MRIYKNFGLAAMAVIMFSSCSNDEKLTNYRGKVKFETVSVSGKLAGRVENILVEEGQKVKAGDTLAVISIPEVDAKMKQAEGAVAAARGQLDMAVNGATMEQLQQIEGKLEAGKAQLNFAEESFGRMQAMYQDSLVSKQQFDEVRMKLEMARAQVNALEAKRKEVQTGARKEQLAQAQGQLNRAIGSRDEVLTASKEQYLTAPVDMSVETVSLSEGELLTPGYVLVNGYRTGSVYFRFTVPESKIYDFEVDEQLNLVNPYTEEETSARVVAIKQLAKYADITSIAPLYDLSETVYELKVVPTEKDAGDKFYLNSTILLNR